MRKLAPRSLSMPALVLAGFSAVALPLMAVIFVAAIYLDRLALESERLVLSGIQVTRLSDNLADKINAMERNARQYQILGEPALIDLCGVRQQEFAATLSLLEKLEIEEMSEWDLDQMRKDSEAIVLALRSNTPQSPELARELERFERLRKMEAHIDSEGDRFIDSELGALQKTARDAQRFLVFPSVVLIPGALLMMLLLTLLIVRPIRQLADAIHRIGEGRFSQPVPLDGPPEIEALGLKLNWLRERLGALEQDKNRFLRHMSHELKTPLASMREGTELLLDGTVGELNSGQREVAGILHGSGIELQYLIENLLDFGQWQEKKAQLKIQVFELSPVIRFVLRRHQLTAGAKQLDVHTELADFSLKADRDRLRMTLDNLVSNAVKFSPPQGSIHIRTALAENQVIIEVADTGPGIPVAERQKIFEPFYQGKAPQLGHVLGTGIGLSVVWECVRAHGGTIEIIDGEYPGAHFRIRLPREPADA
jgi:two-component system sensor histidine kinase GlrK